MAVGSADKAIVGNYIEFGAYQFECVSSFKYLGIHFNTTASPGFMLKNICMKANKAFYWLINYVSKNHWNVA